MRYQHEWVMIVCLAGMACAMMLALGLEVAKDESKGDRQT